MSCLFDSLSTFVNQSSYALRQKICDYIQSNNEIMKDVSNADLINWTSNTNIDEYISTMRSPATWGGAIEIKAFCDIFTTNVRVRSLPNGRVIEIMCKDNTINWVNLIWTGGHYTPV